MTWWEAALLGFVQGVTEFLPVSSSGHLVIVQDLLGITESTLTFNVVVHFGSLFAVLAALKEDWIPIVKSVLGSADHIKGRRRFMSLVIGSVPVGVVGLLFKDALEPLFESADAAGWMLLATGAILWISDRRSRSKGGERAAEVTVSDALWIGCGQALAILPGLSRSGATIGAGLLRGLDRNTAARFAFLLSAPAILGAVLLEVPSFLSESTLSPLLLLVGFISAALSGYWAITFFLRFLRGGTLLGFALYTWIVGLIVILLF